MKKAVAVLLTCVAMLGLTACGGQKKEGWADADLDFKSASETVTVKKDHAFITYNDVAYYTDYSDGSYEEYSEAFATNRGLEIGMTVEDYAKLYSVKPGYAVWELYSGSNNEYTSFAEYTNQDPSEMYDGTYGNVWLDLGFAKEDGKWRVLRDYEVQNVWFCDADFDDFDEVVVFAVNFDKWGEIQGFSIEHFTYDEVWDTWQGWAD